MWRAYVRFVSLFMAKEDPEDPWQQNALSPDELAFALLLLLSFWAGCVTGMCTVIK